MMNLKQFDVHLDNYKKVKGLRTITPKVFLTQYEWCFFKGKDFYAKYRYFRKNSRHMNQMEMAI